MPSFLLNFSDSLRKAKKGKLTFSRLLLAPGTMLGTSEYLISIVILEIGVAVALYSE